MPDWQRMAGAPNPLPTAEQQKDETAVKLPRHGGNVQFRQRTTIFHVLTLAPAAGAVAVAVEESCNNCGGHRHTPEPGVPAIGGLDPATGQVLGASGEYAIDADNVTKPTGDYHAAAGHRGHRMGERFPGGTEQWTAYRRTVREGLRGGKWVQEPGPEHWFEKVLPAKVVGSYILWKVATEIPCDTDRLFGLALDDNEIELMAFETPIETVTIVEAPLELIPV